MVIFVTALPYGEAIVKAIICGTNMDIADKKWYNAGIL